MPDSAKKTGQKGKKAAQSPSLPGKNRKEAAIPEAVAAPAGPALPFPWRAVYAWPLLILLVLALLLPFSGRAFHIDDTLFVWAGQQIAKHPLDPYGFRLNWDDYELPMSQITKNPPGACYYLAIAGSLGGWSERSLHIAFLLPALGVILLTYALAKRMTESPLLAALVSIAAPVYLISAASVMCDTMMLALWLLAVVLWLKGTDADSPLYYTSAALVIGVAALTKYFGAALIPLLLAYTLYRKRRIGVWALYFVIPVAMLVAYQMWTASIYGRGLLLDAADFATTQKESTTFMGGTLEGLSFLGGCVLPGLLFAPLLWSRLQVVIGGAVSALASALILYGGVALSSGGENKNLALEAYHASPVLFALQLFLYMAGGISILALAISDFLDHKDAKSLLLLLWIYGTFVFASYLNWTVNARSVYPLLPAAAILIVRRLNRPRVQAPERSLVRIGVPLGVSLALAVWLTIGDTQMANSARVAAARAYEQIGKTTNSVWFMGHWGLQYYMQQRGARPANRERPDFQFGDYLVIPQNNTTSFYAVSPYAERHEFEVAGSRGAATMNRNVAAAFYSAFGGPLPFYFGPIPPEKYTLVRFVTHVVQQ